MTKSKVVRKLGKDEDESVVASDADLDAKLELYKSISETTKNLQRILDQYNDRLCSKFLSTFITRRARNQRFINLGFKSIGEFWSKMELYTRFEQTFESVKTIS